MARSATRRRHPAAQPAAAGEINPKAPCPCGSGRRYKHCHGSGYAPPVTRPFEGLPGEADWVALRELVPAATAPLRTKDGKKFTLASVLPGGTPALVRADGSILLGVQLQTSSEEVCIWTPSRISPFARTRAGVPPGSTLARVTSRPSAVRRLPVAAGTSSRSATQSASPGRPSNGRVTGGA